MLSDTHDLQNTSKTQSIRVSKTTHHAHPDSDESIYIEQEICYAPYFTSRGVITFENLTNAKKSLKIILKQLEELTNQNTHKFLILNSKLHLADHIAMSES